MKRPTIPNHKEMCAVGSRVTCSPEPVGTDQDWLVLSEDITSFTNDMLSNGWNVDGSFIPPESDTSPPDERFYSFKLGEDNVIATQSPVFFQRFLAATSVCRRLNVMQKSDRIVLFQAVLYGTGLYIDPSIDPMELIFS